MKINHAFHTPRTLLYYCDDKYPAVGISKWYRMKGEHQSVIVARCGDRLCKAILRPYVDRKGLGEASRRLQKEIVKRVGRIGRVPCLDCILVHPRRLGEVLLKSVQTVLDEMQSPE